MQERGVFVDHSAVHRRSLKILPVLAFVFRRGIVARTIKKSRLGLDVLVSAGLIPA